VSVTQNLFHWKCETKERHCKDLFGSLYKTLCHLP
jgi:hypothetical protein